ncbi:hypothetical protein C8A01DRAFT_43571 [Parachaetomium inaequale]|uniref:Uncharacterized protein n=1 Tax=Parachaetomium inaequale TaxID=2588326 RepID=A0AAN6PLU9_9PEZI|nr:hypothetical protein C8A01DRAFT_43571 [Parachaetomium inaequale]
MRPLQPPGAIARLFHPPAPRRAPRPQQASTPRSRPQRSYSTTPTPTPPNTAPKVNPDKNASTRLDRLLARLPRPLQRYTSRLRGAPVTHVAAFLILHELTAVVPLLGLFGVFHYTEYVPVAWMVAHYGGYVREGVGRFERWFTRRGWFGFGPSGSSSSEGDGESGVIEGQGQGVVGAEAALQRWEADPKYRVLVEVGLAYALTKVLLPVRIVGSVWATPWFAGVLGRLRRVVRRG